MNICHKGISSRYLHKHLINRNLWLVLCFFNFTSFSLLSLISVANSVSWSVLVCVRDRGWIPIIYRFIVMFVSGVNCVVHCTLLYRQKYSLHNNKYGKHRLCLHIYKRRKKKKKNTKRLKSTKTQIKKIKCKYFRFEIYWMAYNLLCSCQWKFAGIPLHRIPQSHTHTEPLPLLKWHMEKEMDCPWSWA